MAVSPRSPKMVKGGIILMDSSSGVVQRIVALQYNPHSLTRSLQAQWYEPQAGGDRAERLRIKGPPVETIKLEAEIDATDGLEFPDQNSTIAQFGIQPQLAALETLVYPTTDQLNSNNQLAAAGTLEIVPMEAPMALFVWSKQRIVPVRVTEFSITEEFFDISLNPIQAKVSLGLRVLTVDDLGFEHRGGQYFMHYHKRKEELARMVDSAALGTLGLERLPL